MKKTLLFPALAVLTALRLSALPGFSPSISDVPGEFVYYQDKTFERESYIGFLMYDEKTYAARYYAPFDSKKSAPEMNVRVYVTLDPDAGHIELTGEKIISARTPDDGEIINYIHDMLYELNARRIKAGLISESTENTKGSSFLFTGTAVKEDFMQFGGTVTVIYDSTVPLFSIKAIENARGTADFFVVTTGRIQSSEDTTFEDFKGFPKNHNDKKHSFKKPKKSKITEYELSDGQRISLDECWQRSMENMWFCQNAAVISIGTINVPSGAKAASGKTASSEVLRTLLKSTGNSYCNWESVEIENNASGCTVRSTVYQPSAENITVNIKKLTAGTDEVFYFLTAAVFKSAYDKNRSYFESVIKSYRVEQ